MLYEKQQAFPKATFKSNMQYSYIALQIGDKQLPLTSEHLDLLGKYHLQFDMQINGQFNVMFLPEHTHVTCRMTDEILENGEQKHIQNKHQFTYTLSQKEVNSSLMGKLWDKIEQSIIKHVRDTSKALAAKDNLLHNRVFTEYCEELSRKIAGHEKEINRLQEHTAYSGHSVERRVVRHIKKAHAQKGYGFAIQPGVQSCISPLGHSGVLRGIGRRDNKIYLKDKEIKGLKAERNKMQAELDRAKNAHPQKKHSFYIQPVETPLGFTFDSITLKVSPVSAINARDNLLTPNEINCIEKTELFPRLSSMAIGVLGVGISALVGYATHAWALSMFLNPVIAIFVQIAPIFTGIYSLDYCYKTIADTKMKSRVDVLTIAESRAKKECDEALAKLDTLPVYPCCPLLVDN